MFLILVWVLGLLTYQLHATLLIGTPTSIQHHIAPLILGQFNC